MLLRKPILDGVEVSAIASNLTSVFAFADDAAMGVLASAIHTRWATVQPESTVDVLLGA